MNASRNGPSAAQALTELAAQQQQQIDDACAQRVDAPPEQHLALAKPYGPQEIGGEQLSVSIGEVLRDMAHAWVKVDPDQCGADEAAMRAACYYAGRMLHEVVVPDIDAHI